MTGEDAAREAEPGFPAGEQEAAMNAKRERPRRTAGRSPLRPTALALAAGGVLIVGWPSVPGADVRPAGLMGARERDQGTHRGSPVRLGKSVRIIRVRRAVRYQLPDDDRTLRLSRNRTVPIGTMIDTRRGRVEIVAAGPSRGTTSRGEFYGAEFVLTQKRSSLVDLELTGGDFTTCDGAEASRRRGGVRTLGAKAEGRFRTKGRYSATTVRGTTWLTEDLCEGTRTRVTHGSVEVKDFVSGRKVTLAERQSGAQGKTPLPAPAPCNPPPGAACSPLPPPASGPPPLPDEYLAHP